MRKFVATVKEGKETQPIIRAFVNEGMGEVYAIRDEIYLKRGKTYKIYYNNKLEATFSPKDRDMVLRIRSNHYSCYIQEES